MPLVLVQNPVKANQGYDWKDIVGEQYHFPNQYKNRCVRGTPFVYYRGTRRPDHKRATPEYFGHGRIGRLWRDVAIPEPLPKKDWAWFCTIEDYIPFPATVPAKIDGAFLERIARNHWSVGVRPLPQDVYERIPDLAGIPRVSERDIVAFPDLANVTITETDTNLLLPRKTTLHDLMRHYLSCHNPVRDPGAVRSFETTHAMAASGFTPTSARRPAEPLAQVG